MEQLLLRLLLRQLDFLTGFLGVSQLLVRLLAAVVAVVLELLLLLVVLLLLILLVFLLSLTLVSMVLISRHHGSIIPL